MDLERLIRDRQDELRGRPENWKDRLRGRFTEIEWGFVGFVICVVIWAGCQIIVQLAKPLG